VSSIKARERAKSDVEQGISGKYEIYEEKLKEELKNKRVKISPVGKVPTVTLTEEDKAKFITLSQAAKNDPTTTTEFFKHEIVESLQNAPEEIRKNMTEPIINTSAASLTDALINTPNYQTVSEIPTEMTSVNTASPFVAFTNIDDPHLKALIPNRDERMLFVERAQALTFAIGNERDRNISR